MVEQGLLYTKNARARGRRARSRFSSFFNVAAIGGKSPRASVGSRNVWRQGGRVKLPACLMAVSSDSLRRIMQIDATVQSEFALDQMESALADWLRARAPIAIGFSGGVDSAYLAVAARRTLDAERVLAIIGRSAPPVAWFMPATASCAGR